MKKPTRVRWGFSLLFFIIGVVAYFDRLNLSIAAPMMMSEFSMDKIQFGILMTVFSVGYAIAQVPGGILAEKYGPRNVIAFAMTWWSMFTLLTAYASSHGVLVAVRFLFGMGEGPLFPATNHFIARWYGKYEKGKANSALLAGSYFGPVIGPSLTVFLMLAIGWRMVFVAYGIIGGILALIWYAMARNTPKEHPGVNEAELNIIQTDNSAALEQNKKSSAPWTKYLESLQFWALGLQYFITLYIVTFFLTWLPMYLMEARNFSLKEMGVAASFPWLAIFIVVMTTGVMSDNLVKSGKSKMLARSIIAGVGLIISGIAIYFAAIATQPIFNVLWLTLALGALGMPVNVSWASCNDLGGKYSGSVSGWMNLWGNLGAAASPLFSAVLATKFGWEGCLVFTALSVIIAVLLWFFVKPDQELKHQSA